MEIFNPHSNIHFLNLRKYSIGIALVLFLGSVALIATRGLNYGLDFTGGVLVEVSYAKPIDAGAVRDTLAKAGYEHALVQSLGGTRELSIRLQPHNATDKNLSQQQGTADQLAATVMKVLQAARPDATLKRTDFVGPQVGSELRNDGIVAVIFVIFGIMIYLWARFEKRFAVAALITEVHDTVVTLGFYALTQRDFDLTVLASVLAVVGYSINDKVVVFDRVRELFRTARRAEPEEVLNRAINNTLSRTIITSLFTGIAMAALFFFGGPAVHGFAITMLFGILIGTLSSIFISSPLLLWMGVSKKDLMPVTKDNPELARRP
ncbi:protein translocase subunit SecF [Metallibacterium scheffleri]